MNDAGAKPSRAAFARSPALSSEHAGFIAEKNLIKRDEIALRQLPTLREHQGPREKKLRLRSEAGVVSAPSAATWASPTNSAFVLLHKLRK
jgi:hypothetical protein